MRKWLAGFALILVAGLLADLYHWHGYLPTAQPDVIPVQSRPTMLPETRQTVTRIKVYKARRYVDLMHEDQILHRYPMRLGFDPLGHKAVEGDGKTPEGIYQIDWRNPNSSFYKSLHISYPNQQDTRHAQQLGASPGGDIMIHGSAPKLGAKGQPLYHYMPRKDWTLGCIAVSNAAMDEIWQLVKDGTSIEIVP